MAQRKKAVKQDGTRDQSVFDHIQSLAADEHHLYSQAPVAKADTERLQKIQVELAPTSSFAGRRNRS